jgi:hypothetical protein
VQCNQWGNFVTLQNYKKELSLQLSPRSIMYISERILATQKIKGRPDDRITISTDKESTELEFLNSLWGLGTE